MFTAPCIDYFEHLKILESGAEDISVTWTMQPVQHLTMWNRSQKPARYKGLLAVGQMLKAISATWISATHATGFMTNGFG